MKLLRRNRNDPQGTGTVGRPADPQEVSAPGDGNTARRRRPEPTLEPIPDGEHKYVPRSPYRTGGN